jgi:hypothetical protein
MDSRCPRKLENLPEAWCSLAVQRLKTLRHTNKELTEDEESKLCGCPWAINHQMANYCFFKLIADHMPDSRDLSTMEIAHFNNMSVEGVNKTEKKALAKVRESKVFEDIENLEGIDGMVEYSE